MLQFDKLPSLWVVLPAVLLCVWLGSLRKPNLNHIPTVGPSGMFSSYITAFQMLFHAREIVEKGYRQYPGQLFKVPMLDKWLVIASSPRMVDDIRQAKDTELSFKDAARQILQQKYTVRLPENWDRYHVSVVRTTLTRNLGSRFPLVYDEIKTAFGDLLPTDGKEWVGVPALDMVRQVVCRASNRFLFDDPLCHNADYINLNIRFTISVFAHATILSLFPEFTKPIIGPFFTPVDSALAQLRKHMGTIVEERIRKHEESGGEWEGRPNDYISWLLDNATEEQRTVHNILFRVLAVNLAAIHTSSNTFTHALYQLALRQEYVEPLRAEVEATLQEEGGEWSKDAMNKMRKIDSFLRESIRMDGIAVTLMNRLVTNESGFTFSDGSYVPHGAFITTPTYAMHHDQAHYGENADEFDGYRFYKMSEDIAQSDGATVSGASKYSMTTTGSDYLAFGYGRQACPGRFFAVNEIKAMFAHVLINYDIKLEEGSNGIPENRWFGIACAPNPKAKVFFRKRQ